MILPHSMILYGKSDCNWPSGTGVEDYNSIQNLQMDAWQKSDEKGSLQLSTFVSKNINIFDIAQGRHFKAKYDLS